MGCSISVILFYELNLPSPTTCVVPIPHSHAVRFGVQSALAMTGFIVRTRGMYPASACGQRIISLATHLDYASSRNSVEIALTKIISGGQTGVDRAALDFAIRHGYEHGGWCPRDRRAEDGPIPSAYVLRETDSFDYVERTGQNVMDSDATLIVAREEELSGGTAFTKACAEQHGRPLLIVCTRDDVSKSAAALSKFLKRNKVRTLNVAGPRESQAPGIGRFVTTLLEAALTPRKERVTKAQIPEQT